MQDKKELAIQKKNSGKYNCAQAVICSYCEEMGIDEEMALNLGSAFCMGLGNTEGTCGALIGAGIVLGVLNKDKIKTLKDISSIMKKFQDRNQATQCKILKGIETKKVLRQCHDCVGDAVEFLEEIIGNK